MIKYIVSAIVLSGVALNVYAMPKKPNACPKAAAIKSGGLAYADKDQGAYVVYQISNYGTKYTWGFGIGDFQANSAQQAISKGYSALSTLRGNPSPTPIYDENVWACLYSTNGGHMAIAFTPLPIGTKMKQSMMMLPTNS